MGIRQSCPSDALDSVWVDDKDAPHCFNCGTNFSLRRRRHHCRCCGGVFCVACWGEMAELEEAYGFPGAVPICTICSEVYKRDGSMFILRRGITVAQTHESRSNVTADSQIPPLANANIRARKFKTNLLTLHHWRPFTKRTKLQLTKTKSSKEVLRAARSAGMTPRGESGLSGRDSASGLSNGPRDSVLVGGGEDGWTIDLDSIESIQLLSFDEKEGGEFICITTGMEEHRLQAVKVRFEEVAAVPCKEQLENENSNNNVPAGAVPIPVSGGSNSRFDGGGNSDYTGASMGRGSIIRNGRLADGGTSLGANSPGRSHSGLQLQNSENYTTNQNNNNNGGENDQNNNNNNVHGGESPGNGGEKCSASDRRSMVSTGTRLRTVMLDRDTTRALYNALLRAHHVCRKRAEYIPSQIRSAVEVDFAEDEVQIGQGGTTPRFGGTRQSSPAGFGYGGPSSEDYSGMPQGAQSNPNTSRTPRTRAYTMA